MTTSRTPLRGSSNNFIQIKELGGGAFATVALYQYTGTEPALLQLCAESGGYLAIKRPRTMSAFNDKVEEASRLIEQQIDANEKAITAALQATNAKEKNTPYVRGVNLTIDDVDCIALEFVAYRGQNTATPKSADLQNFLCDTIDDLRHEVTSASNKSTAGLTQMLHGFVLSMKTGLDALHDKGVLHLDFAARNCLVSSVEAKDNQLHFNIKAADYGLSRPMPESGSVPVVNTARMAIHIMDQETLTTKQASVNADIYSYKLAVLEVLSLMIGKEPHEVIKLKDIDSADPKAFFFKRVTLSDENVLKEYLQNYMQLVSELDKNDMRIPIVTSFVESFKAYLTTMPPSGLNTKETRENDNTLFAQAVMQHADKMQQATGKKTLDANKILEALYLSQPKKPEQSKVNTNTASSAAANYVVEMDAVKLSSTAAMMRVLPPNTAAKKAVAKASANTTTDPYSVPEMPKAIKETKTAKKAPAKPAVADAYSVPDIPDKPTTPRKSGP